MAKHKWLLSWPGNICLKCGADDPVEQCVGICTRAPLDENGIHDPSKCPEHTKSEYWECPVEEEDGAGTPAAKDDDHESDQAR